MDGPAKGQAVMAQWERMLAVWYETVGYDRKTGKPLPETLQRLGLDWLAEVLKRFSARHPELDRALWEPSTRELGSHIEVLVNDAVLGISHTLDSPLRPGDRISLVGAFMGG